MFLDLFRTTNLSTAGNCSLFTHCHSGSPLSVAARYGHLNIVQMLVAAGAQTDLADTEGQTAVEMARKFKHTRVLALLHPNLTLTIFHVAFSFVFFVKSLVVGFPLPHLSGLFRPQCWFG